MIEYVCPLCGSSVMLIYLTCNPPIPEYRCTSCAYVHRMKQVEVTRVVAPRPSSEADGGGRAQNADNLGHPSQKKENK